VAHVFHASLQQKDDWLLQQMPEGYGPVFAAHMVSEEVAKRLPSKLALWQHATSLGGVESLIEWRRMTDPRADRRLLRFSVGLEGAEDLIKDLERGITEVLEELGEEKTSGYSNGDNGINGANGVTEA
jgi:cystathionine beta-lyase